MSRYVHDESRSVHQPSMAGASFEFLVEITFPLLDLRGLKATQDLPTGIILVEGTGYLASRIYMDLAKLSALYENIEQYNHA